MAARRRLEVIHRAPAGNPRPLPLLFVHGAYTGAWCWDEHFLPFFAEHGYAAWAVSLSGHGRSEGHDALDSLRLQDYVDDVADTMATLPAAPVLIGHSMGGLVVQKVLERRTAPGAALLCSVPSRGLGPSMLDMMLHRPGLLLALNAILSGRQPEPDRIREALFHQPVDDVRLRRFVRRCQPESMRALWDMTAFDLPQPWRMHRVPMLVIGAGADRLIPPAEVEVGALALAVQATIFPDLGHAVMLERDWQRVAQHVLDWLPTLQQPGDPT
ncbi:MAG: alpha/beta hydrolase [Zoogloeaceae bacterium]|nr:alpha/beta hydrolase [Zoogloeaceae bacterium]